MHFYNYKSIFCTVLNLLYIQINKIYFYFNNPSSLPSSTILYITTTHVSLPIALVTNPTTQFSPIIFIAFFTTKSKSDSPYSISLFSHHSNLLTPTSLSQKHTPYFYFRPLGQNACYRHLLNTYHLNSEINLLQLSISAPIHFFITLFKVYPITLSPPHIPKGYFLSRSNK